MGNDDMAFLARELSVLAYANGFAIVYLTKVGCVNHEYPGQAGEN